MKLYEAPSPNARRVHVFMIQSCFAIRCASVYGGMANASMNTQICLSGAHVKKNSFFASFIRLKIDFNTSSEFLLLFILKLFS